MNYDEPLFCRICAEGLTLSERVNGVCRSCRRAAVRGFPDFCMVCGEPIWGRHGRACCRDHTDTLRDIGRTERLNLDYDDLPETCRDERMDKAHPRTIEDIIEAKLRRDHGDGPVVVPELCPGGECWER